MKTIPFLLMLLLPCVACDRQADPIQPALPDRTLPAFTPQSLAKLFSELPIGAEQVREVHDAVSASVSNGYDEEYPLHQMLTAPGCGVGDAGTKAPGMYRQPLRELLLAQFRRQGITKSGADADALLAALSDSEFQLYWPYSEDWDGQQAPLISFDPGYDAESNYAYVLGIGEDGARVVDSVYVDEQVARSRPVWVLNRNTDAGFTPLEIFSGSRPAQEDRRAPASRARRLMLKSFRMLRHYDSWFAGASEFVVKAGSVDGFTASTEAELKLYRPNVTDFVIVVKRKYIGQELPYDSILLPEVTGQLEKMAFLVTEDDGGTRTNWKCEAIVKINSKSYGFTMDIPYNEKDDIVWRGQLPIAFFQEEDEVTGRFGDTVITFELL